VNRQEATQLLRFCAANDNRTVGEADVLAWHDMLSAISYERAYEAARRHYRQQPDVWLKPGHIWRLCKTTTVAEAAQRELEKPCEHGSICGTCKAVHHATESCSSLTSDRAAFARALAIYRRPSEVEA